jgi:hypothetical protein
LGGVNGQVFFWGKLLVWGGLWGFFGFGGVDMRIWREIWGKYFGGGRGRAARLDLRLKGLESWGGVGCVAGPSIPPLAMRLRVAALRMTVLMGIIKAYRIPASHPSQMRDGWGTRAFGSLENAKSRQLQRRRASLDTPLSTPSSEDRSQGTPACRFASRMGLTGVSGRRRRRRWRLCSFRRRGLGRRG